MKLKNLIWGSGLGAALLAGVAANASLVVVDFSSAQTGGTINFVASPGGPNTDPSGYFQFLPPGAAQFQISQNFLGAGLLGEFTAHNLPLGVAQVGINHVTSYGSFAIASIVNNANAITDLRIHDGFGGTLIAPVVWQIISTTSSGGNLAAQGLIAVNDITYTSPNPNPELVAIRNTSGQFLTLSFNFLGVTAPVLKNLMTPAYNPNGMAVPFSGELKATAVPEASTALAGLILLLPFGVSTLRILRRNRLS